MQRTTTVELKTKIKDSFDNDSLQFIGSECRTCTNNFIDDIGINKITICNPCKHPYCSDCLCGWFSTGNNSCPMCRQQIVSLILSNKEEKSYNDFCIDNNIDNNYGFTNNSFSLDDLILNDENDISPNNSPFDFNFFQDMNFELKNSKEIIGYDNLNEHVDNDFIFIHSDKVLTFISNFFSEIEKNDDIVIILDVSGSMEGERINKSIEAIISIVNSLEKYQRISLVVFSDKARHIFPLQQISSANKDDIIESIGYIQAFGGTIYNNALETIKMIFDESTEKDVSQRKKIVLFFSDGEHNDILDLSILNKTYDTYPDLLFYTISMGNNINASENLMPLHKHNSEVRPVNLGQYYDCPNMNDFLQINENIIGKSRPILARNVEISFSNNITLFTSNKVINDEHGNTKLIIPIINIGDVHNIAFKFNDTNIEDIDISYILIKNDDNSIQNGKSQYDRDRILSKEVTHDFPLLRYILHDINLIVESSTLSKDDKKTQLIEIRNTISIENNGIYYDILLETINGYIESYERENLPMEKMNRQISVRLTSETETSPCDVSRDISGRYFTNSNSANFSTSSACAVNDINHEVDEETVFNFISKNEDKELIENI
jgi:uncharacterized protein YegL